MSLRVVVIGAGIVGAATAWELVKGGHAVTIVESGEPGGPQAASYGNGAWLSPASVVPMSMPGLWRKVPGFLLDRDGPLTIRWTMLPRLMPWLARFILAGATIGKVEATARALSSLLHDAPERHAALAAEIGQPGLIRRTGLLYAYPNREAFLAEALAWRLRRDNGVGWVELGARNCTSANPPLRPATRSARSSRRERIAPIPAPMWPHSPPMPSRMARSFAAPSPPVSRSRTAACEAC